MTIRLERLNEGPASKGAGPFFSCQIEMEWLKCQAMQAAMLEHYIGDETTAIYEAPLSDDVIRAITRSLNVTIPTTSRSCSTTSAREIPSVTRCRAA